MVGGYYLIYRLIDYHFSSTHHLEVLSSFLQGTHLVALVLLGGMTHTAEDFKIIQTEELEDFPMCDTVRLHHPSFLPCPTSPSCGRLSLLLPQKSVSHVLQGQADRGLCQRALPPANGALTPGLLLVPELLQTGPTEAVAALEHHRLLENFTADRTRQFLFQHGA